MNEKSYSDYIVGIIALFVVIALVVYPATANIPPTPAFSKIKIIDELGIELVLFNATKYNDALTFTTNNLFLFPLPNNTVSISLDHPNSDRLGGVYSGECTQTNHYMTGIDVHGKIICGFWDAVP